MVQHSCSSTFDCQGEMPVRGNPTLLASHGQISHTGAESNVSMGTFLARVVMPMFMVFIATFLDRTQCYRFIVLALGNVLERGDSDRGSYAD